jgi:hypothetical protein
MAKKFKYGSMSDKEKSIYQQAFSNSRAKDYEGRVLDAENAVKKQRELIKAAKTGLIRKKVKERMKKMDDAG